MKSRMVCSLAAASVFILLLPGTGFAYVGPGAGLTAIGAVLAFLGAILLAILGFIWYPLRRLWRSIRNSPKPGALAAVEASEERKSGN